LIAGKSIGLSESETQNAHTALIAGVSCNDSSSQVREAPSAYPGQKSI
jgi:hypothetical protein